MKIAIFGASGQGRELADICSEIGYTDIVFLVSSNTETCIYPNEVIVDTVQNIEALEKEGYVFGIGVGSPNIRKRISEKYNYLSYPNIIHPSASFGLYQRDALNQSVGNIVTAGVRFTNNIKCGNFGLYNLNATIAHDSIIDDFVSVMADVNISGNIHICQNVYLGVNATILHGDNNKKLTIGKNSTVGASALVTKDVPPNVTVVGVPATIIQK